MTLLVLSCATSFAAHAAEPVGVQSPPDISGMWEALDDYKLRVRTTDGEKIPLQPWALEYAREQRARDRSGNPAPNNNHLCLPSGLIRQYQGQYPFIITQTASEVLFLFEENHRYNLAYFNQAHPQKLQPSWYGHSIARWEGETLVIDTVGTKGKTPLSGGITHTDALHMTHRIRLLDGGTRLEDRVTMDDPKAYTRPWELITVFQRRDPETTPFLEDVCAENNGEFLPAD